MAVAARSPTVQEEEEDDKEEEKDRQLSAYMRLWALANALRVASGFVPGTALKDTVQAQPSLALLALFGLAFAAPSHFRGMFAIAALLARVVTNARKGPWMGNSQLWATIMDFTLLVGLAKIALFDKNKKTEYGRRLTANEERAVVRDVGATIRWELGVFYFFSGFWKLNSSFLHPKYSCAAIFTVQPLEYLPDHILFESSVVETAARYIAAVAGPFTVFLECVVPAAHLADPRKYPKLARIGVLLTLAFHLVIGLTPPPSNVSSFGVTTCTRLFFCLPEEVTRVVEDILVANTFSGVATVFSSAFFSAFALAIVDPFHRDAVSTVQGSGQDWHLAYYCALTVILARSVFTSSTAVKNTKNVTILKKKTKGKTTTAKTTTGESISQKQPDDHHLMRDAPPSRLMLALTLVYAAGLPILGLQEKGGALMFSQLRLHGGSNHFLLPTSLLQRWYYDAAPENALAGGVVRVVDTNLTWVGNTFAEHMGPRTLRLVRDVASVPSEYVWSAKGTSGIRMSPPPRFLAHTLSNLGLRRILETAKSQGDALTMKYHRLRGPTGDETWRTASLDGATTVSLDIDALGTVVRCDQRVAFSYNKEEEETTTRPCDARELGLIAPATDRLSLVLTTMLLPQPNPIVPGHTEEMHCVTWG